MESKKTLEELSNKGREFLNAVEQAEAEISAQFLAGNSQQVEVWLEAIGLLLKCYECKSGVPGTPNEIASKQLVYFSTFVQGVSATTRCITNGHYAKAVAMLKQDVEIFARVREISKGSDVEGKTPNVGHLPEGFRMLYGAMNKLAHPSNTDLLEEHLKLVELDNELGVGLSPIPAFNSYTAMALCEFHAHLCFQMAREYLIMLARMHSPSDVAVQRLLVDVNLLADRIAMVLKPAEQ